jgi:hypothetical protein
MDGSWLNPAGKIIDIIGNNPQISPITQIREFSKEKSAKICVICG